MAVVDASLAVKWLVAEMDSNHADRPDLWLRDLEVGNGVSIESLPT